MNTANGTNPTYDGVWFRPHVVRPALVVTPTSAGVTNAIPPTAKVIDVAAVANDANDWITLPALSTVPNGHEITILCNAGTNFELRTPATSGEKINTVDSDGTQEYLCTDTEVLKVVKVSNTDGWMAHGYTALGAVATAVVPD